ncbi:MAG: hypothetical protein P8Y51_07265, partial [Campylobacterales bacterium]
DVSDHCYFQTFHKRYFTLNVLNRTRDTDRESAVPEKLCFSAQRDGLMKRAMLKKLILTVFDS